MAGPKLTPDVSRRTAGPYPHPRGEESFHRGKDDGGGVNDFGANGSRYCGEKLSLHDLHWTFEITSLSPMRTKLVKESPGVLEVRSFHALREPAINGSEPG